MKLGIDLDGVCADFQGGWVRAYNLYFEARIPGSSAKTYDAALELTHFADYREFWDWVESIPTFWENLEPIPGALGGLYELRRQGHVLEFVTARKEPAHEGTRAWLKRHGLASPYQTLHFTDEKWRTDSQLYIDDTPAIIDGLLARSRRVVRFEQPWNLDAGGWRARSWREVLRWVNDGVGIIDDEDVAA